MARPRPESEAEDLLPPAPPFTPPFMDALVAAGQSAWPTIAVDSDALRARIDAFAGRGFVVEECSHLSDLFFAMALAERNREALRLFEQEWLPTMVRSASHLLSPRLRADDLRQLLRVKLLMAADGGEGKIAQYMGRGPLAGWLRIVSVRAALSLRRTVSADSSHEGDELLQGVAIQGDSPELSHLRSRYEAEFKSCFFDALMSLDVADRNLLRLHHVEGLTVDEIAPVFQIHRATVARRLTKAREEIAERTRSLLVSRLRLSESECASILGMILSQLDVSIVRVLSAAGE